MRTITQYTHYNFKDRDPIFDKIFSIIDGHGLTLKQVAAASGMNIKTLSRWKSGKSKQAYYSSIVRVVIGLRKWDFKLIDEDVKKKEFKRNFKVINLRNNTKGLDALGNHIRKTA